MVLKDAREEIYCQEITLGRSQTTAATRAGYSPNNASGIGSELRHRPHIEARIAELLEMRRAKHEITVDRILEELSVLVFSRFDQFGQIKEGTRYVLKLTDKQEDVEDDEDFNVDEDQVESYKFVDFELTKDIDPRLIPAISYIKQGRNGIEMKLHEKAPLIQLAMRYLGMLKDNLKVEGNVNLTNQPVIFE